MAPGNSSSSLGITDYQAVLNLTTSSVPEFSGKSFGFILSGVACANQGSPLTLEVASNHMASDKGTSSSSENREEREKGSKANHERLITKHFALQHSEAGDCMDIRMTASFLPCSQPLTQQDPPQEGS